MGSIHQHHHQMTPGRIDQHQHHQHVNITYTVCRLPKVHCYLFAGFRRLWCTLGQWSIQMLWWSYWKKVRADALDVDVWEHARLHSSGPMSTKGNCPLPPLLKLHGVCRNHWLYWNCTVHVDAQIVLKVLLCLQTLWLYWSCIVFADTHIVLKLHWAGRHPGRIEGAACWQILWL